MWSFCSGAIWCSAFLFLNRYDFSYFEESGKFFFFNEHTEDLVYAIQLELFFFFYALNT